MLHLFIVTASNPCLGLNSFKLIDEYVQNEPVQEFDKAMHGMLAEIGIVKESNLLMQTRCRCPIRCWCM